jgi:ppGpp synthetase/RelA/SpoT-type nucleotidyltranferase
MSLSLELIEQAVARYWREYDRYAKLAEFVGDACRKLLDENVIRGSVQWRPKNPDRLRLKLQKQMASGDHAAEYTDLDSVFRVQKDLAGTRITTYVETERPKVVTLVQKRFGGFAPDGSVTTDVKDKTGQFYRATHCMVRIQDPELVGRYQNLKGLGCEVQVCSLLAHVYNEIEHDLRYKPLTGTLSPKENSLLNGLGHLMETGDIIIDQTLDAVEMRQKQNVAEFEDEYDFVARMRPLFPQAENFAANAGQLHEVCIKLGLDSPDKLKQALNWQDDTAQNGLNLANKLADYVNPQGGQLEIDPGSSDPLLVLLLEDPDRVEKLKELYPSGQGIGRAPRFLSVAKQLHSMPEAQ